MPEFSPFAQALAGGAQGDIQEPIRGMILQALQPDNLTKMIIKEDGGIDFKVTPQTLEKVAGAMGPAKGPSAGEMRGLTPEQMMSLMQATQAGEQGRMQTLQQFMGIPTQRAQIEALKAQAIRNIAAALPEQFETETDELGRVFLRNKRTGETKQVSGVPPLSYEQRMELAKTPKEIERGIEWRNKKTGELKYLPKGQVPSGTDWEKAPAIERQVSELPGLRFEESKARNVANMIDKIEADPKFVGNKGLIDYVNQASSGNVGYIWTPVAKEFSIMDPRWWGEEEKAVRVELPSVAGKQMTMNDIRRYAEANGITVDAALTKVYEKLQKKEKK